MSYQIRKGTPKAVEPRQREKLRADQKSRLEKIADRLFSEMVDHARAGRICPPVDDMMREHRCNGHTIRAAFTLLRQKGKLDWSLVYRNRQVIGRVVTITGRKMRTGNPRPPKPDRVEFTPTVLGCPVRSLAGEEFQRRAAEIVARDGTEWRPFGREREMRPPINMV